MFKNQIEKIGFFIIFFILWVPLLAQDNSTLGERIQFDLQGESHFSRYNFTNIKIPYNGIDCWTEFKIALWLNSGQSFAPYISVIPSLTSEGEFWWQKNAQLAAGLQWYPFPTKNLFFRGIRLYSLVAYRDYFSEPEVAAPENTDLQLGADYYYDNLFGSGTLASVLWSNGGYRKTNFTFKDYNAFLWMGNTKIGVKTSDSQKVLMGYLVLEWTYAPIYERHWWENFLRTGVGVRFYPWAKKGGSFVEDFLRRFQLNAEFLYNALWLGDSPVSGNVKKSDFRIGLSFSTGGFFRDR